jgi:hypothetical protein
MMLLVDCVVKLCLLLNTFCCFLKLINQFLTSVMQLESLISLNCLKYEKNVKIKFLLCLTKTVCHFLWTKYTGNWAVFLNFLCFSLND